MPFDASTLGPYLQKGSCSTHTKNQLKFAIVHTKIELIFGTTWDLVPFCEYGPWTLSRRDAHSKIYHSQFCGWMTLNSGQKSRWRLYLLNSIDPQTPTSAHFLSHCLLYKDNLGLVQQTHLCSDKSIVSYSIGWNFHYCKLVKCCPYN